MAQPRVVRTARSLRAAVSRWRAQGDTVALVPTMGSLHDGHLALVKLARCKTKRVVVSIFVNPAQFAPHEDFDRYPREEKADLRKLARVSADLVYAPSVEEMYPAGFSTAVHVGGPAEGLESRTRPHFFNGVATVVAKLLIQAMPDVAVFGEKDFQQLRVIQRLVTDLDLPVKILGAPVTREADGLALSSRNAYLSPKERVAAPRLHQSLAGAARQIANGADPAAVTAAAAMALEADGFFVDYVEARRADTLAAIDGDKTGPLRILAAARIGSTRLIDNVEVGSAHPEMHCGG